MKRYYTVIIALCFTVGIVYWMISVSIVKYIVINPTGYEPDPSYRQESLLITDEDEVAQWSRLLLFNPSFSHACGHHYEIAFYGSNEKKLTTVFYNRDCEEFFFYKEKIRRKIDEKIHNTLIN